MVGIDTVIYFTVTDAEVGDLRGRQPAAGDRAADGHHAAQRDRRPDAGGDADLARQHQLASCAWCSTRRPAGGASASTASSSSRSSRRARCRRRWRSRCAPSATAAPRSSPPRASSSPQILTAEGEKQAAVLKAEGARHGGDPERRGRVQGDRDRLPGDPRRRARRAAALLPVPADAAAARAGLGQQGLRHPVGVLAGARQARRRDRRDRDNGASARPRHRRRAGRARRSHRAPTRSTRRPRPTPPRRPRPRPPAARRPQARRRCQA